MPLLTLVSGYKFSSVTLFLICNRCRKGVFCIIQAFKTCNRVTALLCNCLITNSVTRLQINT